jgi:hypothetical protein
VRRLAEQQRDDSEQHQLCGQTWFLLLRGNQSSSLRAAAVAAETLTVDEEMGMHAQTRGSLETMW